jgi:hypothetical protein
MSLAFRGQEGAVGGIAVAQAVVVGMGLVVHAAGIASELGCHLVVAGIGQVVQFGMEAGEQLVGSHGVTFRWYRGVTLPVTAKGSRRSGAAPGAGIAARMFRLY